MASLTRLLLTRRVSVAKFFWYKPGSGSTVLVTSHSSSCRHHSEHVPDLDVEVDVVAGTHHDTAWAMTVHRSQGSEFDSVLLILPPQPHELAGPELLYTGVTRARSRILLAADEAALRAACERRTPRRTGLLEKLRTRNNSSRA